MGEFKSHRICPHDAVAEIPGFVLLEESDREAVMRNVKCSCLMRGWWTKISLGKTLRQDYPAYICKDCKITIIVNSYDGTIKDYTIGDVRNA